MGGPDKSGLSPVATYTLSATASCLAETATFPLDLIKTRLQVQQTGARALQMASAAPPDPPAGRGLVGTAVGVVREEGLAALYGGLGPACLRHVVYSGSR